MIVIVIVIGFLRDGNEAVGGMRIMYGVFVALRNCDGMDMWNK